MEKRNSKWKTKEISKILPSMEKCFVKSKNEEKRINLPSMDKAEVKPKSEECSIKSVISSINDWLLTLSMLN